MQLTRQLSNSPFFANWNWEHAGPPGGRAGSVISKFRVLVEAYGWRLLGMLAFSQWIVKGLVWGFNVTAVDFLLRDYGVPGPKLQVYKAIAYLPWAMKPVFGMFSDAFPICGYNKAPYISAASAVAFAAHLAIGVDTERHLPIELVVTCLALGVVQVSLVDLLTEAQYSSKIRERPQHGPDLLTFVWTGITIGNLVATASAGPLIEWLGAFRIYAVIAIPSMSVLLPTGLNWLEETKISHSAAAVGRAKLAEQPELIFLVVLMGVATLVLVGVGLVQDSAWTNLAVASLVSVVVAAAFMLLLRPMISRMNCFFFVQTCCTVDISGAAFYFFTDDKAAYPEGPHFSTTFFASGLGVCVALLNLVGMWIYNHHMQTWSYRSLFVFANLLLCAVNSFGLLVYTRLNLVVGMPDALFVLGTWGTVGIVQMWMWLPGLVLLSQLCPSGVEATMFALLAGCHNLGLSVASYAGAYLLESLGVAPRGAVDEGREFKNLWVAGLVQAVAPALTLVLLPWMIPDALQTEQLLKGEESAVDGSPVQWLRARRAGYGSF